MVLAVTFGPADIAPAEVWQTIAHHLGLPVANPVTRLRDAIIWELRLPRVLVAAGIGAGLALCGAIMQALTRNPLADPYLLGLSSGASFGAVMFLLAGAALLMPVGAFLGAGLAMALTLAMTRLLGGATPSRAILAGIAVSALAAAATSFAIFWTATGDSYREILSWLMGSLSGSGWADTLSCACILPRRWTPLPLAIRRRQRSGSTWRGCAGCCWGRRHCSPVRWWRLAGRSALSA